MNKDRKQIVFDYEPVYDIILMDVEMPGLDGMSAAEKIRETDRDVIIIFITNMAQKREKRMIPCFSQEKMDSSK